MAKQYIFKQKPTRKNFNSLKRFGFVEINGDRDFVKLNLKVHKELAIDIHEKLLKFLQNQGFFLLKTHGINRAGNHNKSYLNETPFNAVLSPTSPKGDFSNEKEHNISLKTTPSAPPTLAEPKEFNKDLTATQQVASPKCPSDTSLNPDNSEVTPKFKIFLL